MELDTIAAIATAVNNSGISIIRMSGEDAVKICNRIFMSRNKKIILENPQTHSVHYGFIMDQDEMIDEVLVMYMKGPKSYTAEDVVEIHCHGGISVTNKVLQIVLKNGARLAEPGEFTKRAFLNGRIDLTEAEAVMDLIHSKNEFSRKNSMKQLKGSVRKEIEKMRKGLLHEIAFLESALDDPEHYELLDYGKSLDQIINRQLEESRKILRNSRNGQLLKEGIQTVIVGKPNVGKSSILNLLVGNERAIVTDIEGTTRDILEERVLLDDIILNIIDTAGIRETQDMVEKIGVERSIQSIEDAELILFVVDSSMPFTEEDNNILRLIKDKKGIILLNKTDLKTEQDNILETLGEKCSFRVIPFSAKEESGLEELSSYIKELVFDGNFESDTEICLTNARQQNLLEESIEFLLLVKQSIEDGMPEDFYTIDLMNAYTSLGKMIGEEVEDDVVDEIFHSFCMGK